MANSLKVKDVQYECHLSWEDTEGLMYDNEVISDGNITRFTISFEDGNSVHLYYDEKTNAYGYRSDIPQEIVTICDYAGEVLLDSGGDYETASLKIREYAGENFVSAGNENTNNMTLAMKKVAETIMELSKKRTEAYAKNDDETSLNLEMETRSAGEDLAYMYLESFNLNESNLKKIRLTWETSDGETFEDILVSKEIEPHVLQECINLALARQEDEVANFLSNIRKLGYEAKISQERIEKHDFNTPEEDKYFDLNEEQIDKRLENLIAYKNYKEENNCLKFPTIPYQFGQEQIAENIAQVFSDNVNSLVGVKSLGLEISLYETSDYYEAEEEDDEALDDHPMYEFQIWDKNGQGEMIYESGRYCCIESCFDEIKEYLYDERLLIATTDNSICLDRGVYKLCLNGVEDEFVSALRVFEYAENRLSANPQDKSIEHLKLQSMEDAKEVIAHFGERVIEVEPRYCIVETKVNNGGTETVEDYADLDTATSAFEFIRQNNYHNAEHGDSKRTLFFQEGTILSMDIEYWGKGDNSNQGFKGIDIEPINIKRQEVSNAIAETIEFLKKSQVQHVEYAQG